MKEGWHALIQAMSRRKTLKQAMLMTEPSSGGGGSNSNSSTTVVGLKRTLTATDLVLYGIGSSVGAGIYVLVGLGAALTGPAISLSFFITGVSCILTAMAYAEFAAQIPVTGSAFMYLYVAFGEVWAWLVGWNLTLGYGFTTSVVARAWAAYVGHFLQSNLPTSWSSNGSWFAAVLEWATEWQPFGSGNDTNDDSTTTYTCSPLSCVIVAINTAILLRGVQDSSRFNNVMTALNVAVLLSVIFCSGVLLVTAPAAWSANLTPYFVPPQPVANVLSGAGLVFFAFIGFDMVASLSEEVVQPARNMPIGIVGSLIVSTVLYVSVALAVVAMAPIPLLGARVPIVNALLANACCTAQEQNDLVYQIQHHHYHYSPQQYQEQPFAACLTACPHEYIRPWLAVVSHLVSAGAIFGLMASCFTSLMGQPRILYSLARDGLIPRIFGQVDPTTQVPVAGIVLTGLVTALLACFCPMEALANLISLGTLLVFTLVDAAVIILRLRRLVETSAATTTTTTTSASTIHHPTMIHHLQQRPPQHRAASMAAATTKYSPVTTVTLWILLFSLATLTTAMLLSHGPNSSTTSSVLVGMSTLVALRSVHAICKASPTSTWNVLPATPPSVTVIPNHNHVVETFQCPGMPLIPLGGMAANIIMMGSLPLSSWLFCLVWLACGMVIYLGYGIRHSALRVTDLHCHHDHGQVPLSSSSSATDHHHHGHHHESRPLLLSSWWQGAGNVSSLEAVDDVDLDDDNNNDTAGVLGMYESIMTTTTTPSLEVSLHGLHARTATAPKSGGESSVIPSAPTSS